MKISVAMCTYNGMQYIQQQLDSIASQTRLPDELIVCDDGSTDATLSILEQFCSNSCFPVLVHSNAENLGVTGNFLKAIELCSGDLISLADQDDVWLPDKLHRAQRLIEQSSNPSHTLYCSRLQYVDKDKAIVGMSSIPHTTDFSNAIVENIATGCSVVFGSEIRRLIILANPKDMVMHDWWAYLLTTAFGQVIYDPVPTLLYRQHGENVAGWEPKPIKIWHRTQSLIQRLMSNKLGMDSLNQAARFISTYPEISQERRDIVEDLLCLRDVSMSCRMRYILHSNVQRNDALENIGLKIMLLMGWH